jgi:chorismate dehydratase
VYRLGAVSFLNARPLIEGLAMAGGVDIVCDVPARLPDRLERGELDAALIPVIDVLRSGRRYRVVSDACIGCDGETMTVRIFSQVPPDHLRVLHVDGDSHTSVALADILWRELYGRELVLQPIAAGERSIDRCEAVLLIGDKVVDSGRGSFAYEVDLGGAWRQHTGLPFVFAVWAVKGSGFRVQGSEKNVAAGPRTGREALAQLLSAARDRGVARAAQIAEMEGPGHGWPVELARRYLTRCLSYKLDARAIEGANRFGQLCVEAGLLPADAEIHWPEELLAQKAV